AQLAGNDAALFLWATWPRLPDALDVIEAWGFTFKTVAFVWVKQNADGDGLHTWRYPGAFPDANFNFAHLKRFAQTLEPRQVRRLLHGRPHGRAQHVPRCVEAQPYSHFVRAVHAFVSIVTGYGAHRSCRHRLDHIRRALSHCTALRFARPSQWRARRVGHCIPPPSLSGAVPRDM